MGTNPKYKDTHNNMHKNQKIILEGNNGIVISKVNKTSASLEFPIVVNSFYYFEIFEPTEIYLLF